MFLFHIQQPFFGLSDGLTKCMCVCVCVYSCVPPRVPCIMFRHFSVMYSDTKKTSNLLNGISKAGLRVVYDHTSSNFIRNVKLLFILES
jgi:hypothetical protein